MQTGMMPGRVNPLHAMVQINQEIFGPGTVACSDDAVTMGLQAATHWDALTHVSHSGRIYNGRPADTITPHGGAEFSGIDKARHIVSRGVLLDVARARSATTGSPAATRSPPRTWRRPRSWRARGSARATSCSYGPGRSRPTSPATSTRTRIPSPGLSVRTPEWFHARDVAAVANDTLTFEIFPPEIEDLWLPVHALDLVEMGMLQGQNWNLEELSTACGQVGRYAFLLSAMPEPFVGATGTPVAPVAIL